MSQHMIACSHPSPMAFFQNPHMMASGGNTVRVREGRASEVDGYVLNRDGSVGKCVMYFSVRNGNAAVTPGKVCQQNRCIKH